MATVQSGNSPGTRVAVGDGILAAAESVDVKPIAARLGAFKKIHASYAAADAKVQKASLALTTQQAKVADADVEQDESVLALADALPADGLPRQNPFKPLGAPAPATLCAMGYASEANAVVALEKAVLKRPNLSKTSATAAKKAGAAAAKVLAALAPIPDLEKKRAGAMQARDALEQAWETAFAGLKRAARAAADDGHAHLFAALFDRAPKPAKKATNKKNADAKKAPADATATPA